MNLPENLEVRWHRTPATEPHRWADDVRVSITWNNHKFLSPAFPGDCSERELKLRASLWFEAEVRPQLEKEKPGQKFTIEEV